MTVAMAPGEVAARLRGQFSEISTDVGPNWLRIAHPDLLTVFRFARDDAELDFAYLTSLTSVDWLDRFELVYHLQSLRRNHIAVLKVALERENPIVPSVTPIWEGARLQEAEVYDLMGIRFEGHPSLRRIFLWEGFAGWPLRKDFLQLGQGAYNPGLPHFPKEGEDRGVLTGPNWTQPAVVRETPGEAQEGAP
jgi:NADH-quinone oxidoreductase subunit C